MMKKLTLTKGKIIFYLILLCLFLAQSCRKDILQPKSDVLQGGISIAEAKAYFNTNLRKANKSERLMSTGTLQKEITIEDFLANKQPLWEKAYQKTLATGESVKVPIDFGKAYAVINKAKDEVVPLSSLNYLFMYKDSLNAVHAEWVVLLPDSAWLYGNRNKYTGSIMVKDWEGKTIKNFIFNDAGSINTSSTLKRKLLNSIRPTIVSNEESETPLVGPGRYCIRIPTGKCPKQPPRCDANYCDGCLELCAKEFCTWLPACGSPECELPPEPGSGGGGEGPRNPTRPGGGGAYPPDDCSGGKQLPNTPATGNTDDNSIPLPPCIPKPAKLESVDEVPIPIPTPEELEPIFLPYDFDVIYEQEWYDNEDELGIIGLELLQQGISDTDPIPESYYKKGTAIDMAPATPIKGRTVTGAPRSPKYFWEELIKKRPEMFSAENRGFIANNKFANVVADDQWIKYNPTHKAYRFNQLVHHHHEQGNMAFAIPAKVHQKWTSILHQLRANGKTLKLSGRLNTLGGFMQIFSILTDIKTGNPDAWVNGFGATNEKGKLYKEQLQNFYFEITDQMVYKNSNGTIIRAIVTYDAFEDYIWDDDEKRYMGVLKIATYVEDIDTINHRTNSLTKK